MSALENSRDRSDAVDRVVAMHRDYYAATWGFGPAFTLEIERDMTAFLERLDPARDGSWVAVDDGRVVGSVTIDGTDAVDDADAQLHWFIVDQACHGLGLGHKLLDRAILFCRQAGHRRVCLHTFAGLDAARRLYEKVGFRLVDEKDKDPWGLNVRLQVFEAEFLPDRATA